jgi:hypothetical protein
MTRFKDASKFNEMKPFWKSLVPLSYILYHTSVVSSVISVRVLGGGGSNGHYRRRDPQRYNAIVLDCWSNGNSRDRTGKAVDNQQSSLITASAISIFVLLRSYQPYTHIKRIILLRNH